MIVTGVIGVLLLTNVLTLYLYIKEDVVNQNNIRTFVANEEGYRKLVDSLQNSLVDHKEMISNQNKQLEKSFTIAVDDFFNKGEE